METIIENSESCGKVKGLKTLVISGKWDEENDWLFMVICFEEYSPKNILSEDRTILLFYLLKLKRRASIFLSVWSERRFKGKAVLR